jgi:uroporphyrinogen decarboxylase
MLKMAKDQGGYALGSGNSIPDFVPDENYLALLKVGMEE